MRWYTLLPLVACVSIGMRLLPFVIGPFLKRFAFLHKLSVMLPICLLLLITCYTIQGQQNPGWAEAFALCAVIGTQIFTRTILISLSVGVVVDQILRMILLTS